MFASPSASLRWSPHKSRSCKLSCQIHAIMLREQIQNERIHIVWHLSTWRCPAELPKSQQELCSRLLPYSFKTWAENHCVNRSTFVASCSTCLWIMDQVSMLGLLGVPTHTATPTWSPATNTVVNHSEVLHSFALVQRGTLATLKCEQLNDLASTACFQTSGRTYNLSIWYVFLFHTSNVSLWK